MEDFVFETTLLTKLQESETETEIKTKLAGDFMNDGNNRGVKFAYLIAWRTLMQQKITVSVDNNRIITWEN